jgi:pimeloyl-ACP methyl ester carboxylesterase
MDLIGEDLSLRHPTWGRLHIRNKRPGGVDNFSSNRVVVVQHNATDGATIFDVPFNGMSWMDYIAARGFDVYCYDLPGYCRSERPPQMSEPAANNAPFLHTQDAVDCLSHVMDFVSTRRNVDRVDLIGWSWGTAVSSIYAGANPERVERLTLYAPVWERSGTERSPLQVDGPIDAYRSITKEATIKRRRNGLADEQADALLPSEWFEQWWTATLAADPDAPPNTLRAPNGVVEDARNTWNVGKSPYDPSKIKCAVLVIVGELDPDTQPELAIKLIPLLTGARWKRLTIISGGTHAIMMEANRMLLFRSVQQFLEEQPPGLDAVN